MLKWTDFNKTDTNYITNLKFCLINLDIFLNYNSMLAQMCMLCTSIIKLAHSRTCIKLLWLRLPRLLQLIIASVQIRRHQQISCQSLYCHLQWWRSLFFLNSKIQNWSVGGVWNFSYLSYLLEFCGGNWQTQLLGFPTVS